MRKIVKIKLIKFFLVVMSFCSIFAVTYMLNTAYIKKNTEMMDVVVASKKIPAFSLIEESALTIAKRPLAVIPKEAVLNPEELLPGRNVHAGDLGFGEGDIIRTDRLISEDGSEIPQLARLAEENKMLVAVNTNLVRSCANMVVPGTLADAVVVVKGQMHNEQDRVIGPQDDPKLAGLLVIDKKNAEGAKPDEQGRDSIPAVITLLLDRGNMDTAKALVHYNEIGSIYLLPVDFKGDRYLFSLNGYQINNSERG